MHDFRFFNNQLLLNPLLFIVLWMSIDTYSANTVDFKTGDTFYSFFWTQSATDTNKYGYYGLLKITGQSQYPGTTNYKGSFRLDRCPWWQRLVANVNTDISISISDSKPDSVDLCAAKFAAVPWLNAISGGTDTADYRIRFLFPILPIGQNYACYDYFSVRFNDTIDVQFQGIDDSTMAGSFINRRVPGSITTIYAKNAIAIRTTAKNPTRIGSIQVNGAYEKLVSSFLRFDLSYLKSNAVWYGLNFIDTTIDEQTIQVLSVNLSGAPRIFADSTYQLTWSMSGADNVARCSLYVSFDSTKTWRATGMTTGSATSYKWTAPHIEALHCFIKVIAIDKNGLKHTGQSSEFEIRFFWDTTIKLPPINNYSLRGSVLTPTSARLAWSLTGEADTSVDSIGIRYDILHYPASMTDSMSKLIRVYGLNDTCDTIKDLPENQPWYFSLFVANSARIWSSCTPNSRLMIRPGKANGIVINLGIDTQHVFNDSLRLWTKPKLPVTYTDTLEQWNGPPDKPGFIQTSQGYAFRQGNIPANTVIGVSISFRSIPSPYTAYDQKIYQYNIYTGNWRLMATSVKIDISKHSIEALCHDPRMPFVAMIDTLAPIVRRLSTAKEFYTIHQQIVDTCTISDNIENLQIRLIGGTGNGEMSDLSGYITPLDEESHYRVSLPPYVADECAGLRSFLIGDDGRMSTKINLSEKIRRNEKNCDDTIAAAMDWTPLFVTAQPEKPSVADAILSGHEYDKKNERIILWRQSGNDGENKWLDYSSDSDSLFLLLPGRLFWIKSRSTRAIKYGIAIVPVLADTFTIELNPGGWTDFSIPYQFDSYLGDILNATRKKSGSLTDSIGIYKWEKNGLSYITHPVFLSGIDSLSDSTRILPGGKPYSAYNPFSSTLSLRIPSEGTLLSPLNHLFKSIRRKAAKNGSWSVRIGITMNDTLRFAPIYFASTPASGIPRWYPISPSFSPLTVGIKNRINNMVYGNTASGDLSKGGCMFEIYCYNTGSSTSTLNMRIEHSDGLPDDMTSCLLSTNGANEGRSDAIHLPLFPHRPVTCYLLIGNMQYIMETSRQLLSRLSLRIVSFGGNLRLLFTIPYDTRSIEFMVYDLNGREVWNLKQNTTNISANSAILIKKPLSAGFYLIELKATIGEERVSRMIRQKVIYVR